MSAPLLFLGHAADRTGPPIYLLHMLRWLRTTHPTVEFEVALLAGGELLDDFRALAPTSVYAGLPPGRWDLAEKTWLLANLDQEERWWAARRQRQLEFQMRQHADARVVYVNAAPSIDLAMALPPGQRSQVSHIHELETGIAHRLDGRARAALLDDADAVFVVADAVGTNLVARHGVDPVRVAKHPGAIHVADIEAIVDHRDGVDHRDHRDRRDARSARSARGLPPDGLIVGASGTLDWRKAPDLFTRMAWHVQNQHRPEPVTFVWVGGHDELVQRAIAEARWLGLGESVRFVGIQPDPIDWFAIFDVFVLPSREDPFPLVCLEAAAVGCPVVAFDTGGIPELLTRGCGSVVAYPDVEQLATEVGVLLDDPTLRRSLGQRGRELIQTDHDVAVLGPRWWDDVARWLP